MARPCVDQTCNKTNNYIKHNLNTVQVNHAPTTYSRIDNF